MMPATEDEQNSQPLPGALDAAWKIHAAQVDWTGKVDTKAIFAFAIQSGALGLVVTLSSADRIFDDLHTRIGATGYYLGIAALIIGAGFALFVVKPRLRGRDAKLEAKNGYIYFGHLQHWNANELSRRLNEGADLLGVVTTQCVTMAKISWSKHRLVQAAVISGAIGMLLLVLTGLYLAQ